MTEFHDNTKIYENEGIDNNTIKDTFDKFESEINDSGYYIDINDEDTKVELRRCMCKDVNSLVITGPLNPSNPAYDNDRICEKTPGGKCGLYHCECYEEFDWYTGQCSYCDDFIESKTKAKRIPLHSGGFKGCFCSNKCLHECYADNTSAIEHMLIEIMQEFQNIIDVYNTEDFNKTNTACVESDNCEDDEEEYINEEETFVPMEPESFDI